MYCRYRRSGCMYVCRPMYVYMYVYVCIYACICMYVCIYACMYVYVWCMYVCIEKIYIKKVKKDYFFSMYCRYRRSGCMYVCVCQSVMVGKGIFIGYCHKTLMKREREMFYLTTHSTHFIYGYMASDIWLRTILIVRKETRCRHIGYSYRLTARVILYAPSHTG